VRAEIMGSCPSRRSATQTSACDGPAHNGIVDGAARRPVPNDRGFPLIGNAEAATSRALIPAWSTAAAWSPAWSTRWLRDHVDQSGSRVELREFLLRGRNRQHSGIEHNGSGRVVP